METPLPIMREDLTKFAPPIVNTTKYAGSIRPMRSPTRSPLQSQSSASRQQAVIPPTAIIALNRLAYGPRPGDVAAFNELAATDVARLTKYVDEQLNPAAIDDSEFDALLDSLQFTTLTKSVTQLWTDHNYIQGWEKARQPLHETTMTKFLRATHSKKQLLEVVTDFWHDHFSVYGWDWPAISMLPVNDKLIRENAFGNFRQLLEKIGSSTAMLFYLDNVYSDAEGPNENYARELLELHTLGADAYKGVMPREDVPGYPNAPEGFVDDDVVAIARCLTGWSVRYQSWNPAIGSTGEFVYRADWHDNDAKIVLGQLLPANQPAQKDGRDVFDIVAHHPATANHICRKLCHKLISDAPPLAVVEAAAALFLETADEPDQLKQVIRFIILSAEFRSTWGSKIKRPFHVAIAALRATESSLIMGQDQDESNIFLWFFSQQGHYPFDWQPPNGYPDVQPYWAATSTLLMRWRMLSWLPHWIKTESNSYYADILGQTPATLTTPIELVDYWIDRIFGYVLSDATRTIFIEMMAQGRNPAYALPIQTSDSVQHRLRSVVGTMLVSPEFQQR